MQTIRGRPRVVSDQALLDAAARVLRRDGSRTTTFAIAREAGVSKALLFSRYRTKEELIAAVIERETRITEAFLAHVDDPARKPLREGLIELGAHLLVILRRTMTFADLARSSPAPCLLLAALHRSRAAPDRLVQSCAHYFDAQIALGRVRRTAPGMLGRIFFGAILQRVLSETSPAARPFFVVDSDAAFLEDLVHALLEGALARAELAPRQAIG
jgi:AcrR family transcriptional regulator